MENDIIHKNKYKQNEERTHMNEILPENYIPELNLISNTEIKKSVIEILRDLPDYFWNIPAASTGKYHPKYAQGPGGLVRHTRAATIIAADLFTIYEFSEIEEDIILAALILHDGLKLGDPEHRYTVAEHPTLMSSRIIHHNPKFVRIAACVASHMGQWTNGLLPLPKTDLEKFVHLCDYLASRKRLEVNFDVEVHR